MAGPAITPSTWQGWLVKSQSVDFGCWMGMPGHSFPARPVPASSLQGKCFPSSGEVHVSVCAGFSSEVRCEVRESPAPPRFAAMCARHGCWQKPSGVSREEPRKGLPAYMP